MEDIVSGMRYTRLLVTVGDYDHEETAAQIRDQVGRAVRGCGFSAVDVAIAELAAEPDVHYRWPVACGDFTSGELWTGNLDRVTCVACRGDLTGVPMVCTACRKPAYSRGAGQWRHDSLDDYLACPRQGHQTMVMVAAGNENVPLQ
jgi:hypothetical protein